MAVPVRTDLISFVKDLDRRAMGGLTRKLDETARHLEGLGRGLPKPDQLLEVASQRLDDQSERLTMAWQTALQNRSQKVALAGSRLRSPREVLDHKQERLTGLSERLTAALNQNRMRADTKYEALRLGERLQQAMTRKFSDAQNQVDRLNGPLEALSYHNVLKRGFAVVKDPSGQVISTVEGAESGSSAVISFQDGDVDAVLGVDSFAAAYTSKTQPKPKKAAKKAAAAKPEKKTAKPTNPDDRQGELL